MPSMANIAAKNAAAATVTFTALVPASGDKASALWRPESLGASPSLRPKLEARAQSNGPKTARRVEIVLVVPYVQTDVASGLASVAASIPFRVEATVPSVVPDSVVADAVAYFQSIIGSALMGDTFKSGFAPS